MTIQTLRDIASPATKEIVDLLLGPFLASCMGKNDMAVACAMVTSAVILVAVHCERENDDFDRLIVGLRRVLDTATDVVSEK